MRRIRALEAASRIVHTDIAVGMDEKPSQALRHGRWKSSMWRAIEAVKKGEADAVVSAGNTGALMAMAQVLPAGRWRASTARRSPALWPTLRGESVVLDCRRHHRRRCRAARSTSPSWARAMARALFDLERPTVGLLNIGVEEVKGLEEVREAGRMLREADAADLDYPGFVEGDDIGKGTVDVVVTEGFTGNIALKTAEGTARQIADLSARRDEPDAARPHRLSARPRRVRRLRDKMDPRQVNGGVFLGLNGIVIKSHGGTDAEGFAAAIDLGYEHGRATSCSRRSTTTWRATARRRRGAATVAETGAM